MIKCRSCRAGKGNASAKLYWRPVNAEDRDPHPAAQRDMKKVQRLREAKFAEKKSRDIVAKATLGSGNLNHDGDNLLLGQIREEVKLRGLKGTLGVTRQEFAKGKRQGIDVYGIHFEDPQTDKPEVLYCLTQSFYQELLRVYSIHTKETKSET
jgi:hypothetical protein